MTRWLRLQENESVATLHVFLVTAATGVVHKVILNSRLNILVWRRSRMVFTLCEFNSMSLRMESRYKIGIFFVDNFIHLAIELQRNDPRRSNRSKFRSMLAQVTVHFMETQFKWITKQLFWEL